MYMRLPFFGLLASRSPMDGLVTHYDKIAECVKVIEESLECYVAGGTCREFGELTEAIDKVEAQADKIKRNIRNHLPRGLFMAVDKTQFLNYTKSQDNIMDAGQEALNWLAMRNVAIPVGYQKAIIEFLGEVIQTTELLGPALKTTISLVHGTSLDREKTKYRVREVRAQRDLVRKMGNALSSRIYNSDMDFKDIYQLIHFIDCLSEMSHNCENCADILRTMIAR